MATYQFSWLDYLIFCSLLACSVLIGVYFGWRGKKKQDNDYLLGSKTQIVPIAASMVASNIAGVALIGIPADIYQYGAMYLWCTISFGIVVIITMYITMPVLLDIGSSSVFEYLELRFNRTIRILASVFSVAYLVLVSPIIIYIPGIILSQLTGLSSTVITVAGCLICVCYTTLGGLNAVIWTDTLQTIMIIVSLVTVLIMGFNASGGISGVWAEALKGERLDLFKFSIDLTDRDSCWTIIIGFTCACLISTSIAQSTLQRLMSLKSFVRAQKALCVFYAGITILFWFITLTGLAIYARYSLCDPFHSKKIKNYDQIVAYYVMDIGGDVFGLPGLFVAGISSAGLSTLSTNLNSLAAVIYCDFVFPNIPHKLNRDHKNLILKIIVVTTGAVCVVIACFIQYFGGIIPLVNSIGGICGAPLLAIYMLGMIFPKSNSKGALTGSVISAAFMLWLTIGSMSYKQSGFVDPATKPVSIENCNYTSNVTYLLDTNTSVNEKPFVLYRVNFWYYMPISISLTIIIGFVISLITRKETDVVRADLISPVFRFLLPQVKSQDCQLYTSLEKSLNVVSQLK